MIFRSHDQRARGHFSNILNACGNNSMTVATGVKFSGTAWQYFNYENEISQDLMINDERNDRDTVKRQRQRHRLLTLIAESIAN